MPLLVIEGCEKVGKTTLAKAVEEHIKDLFSTTYRHWGPAKIDDREYAEPVQTDTLKSLGVNIWDRAWASEHVYAKLLNRDRRLAQDAWLGEWLYGRAVQANGLRVVVTASALELQARRDATDLPVDPMGEQYAFLEYASRFGWMVVRNDYTATSLHENVIQVASALINTLRKRTYPIPPSCWCGPFDANVVFVADGPHTSSTMPGSFLPLTSKAGIAFGRLLGDKAFKCAWTVAHTYPPQMLESVKTIVALGKNAEDWARMYARGGKRLICLPNPLGFARLFRPDASESDRTDSILEMLTAIQGEL